MQANPFLHPTVFTISFFMVALLAESLTSFLFLRGLKKQHPLQWAHSGERTIWTDSDLISAWGTIRYLQRREYLGSGNATGIVFCARHRPFVISTYWAAVISFALFIVLLFTVGMPKE